MASFRLRHFSNPLTLRSIEPGRLLRLFAGYASYFAQRGYELPASVQDAELDYQKLVDILVTSDESTPIELVDALYLIDEMSTPQDMHTLLEACPDLPLDDDGEHSPADVAVQVWLSDSRILERKHAERFLATRESFEYFQSAYEQPPQFKPPTPEAIQALESELDDWFEKKKRGRNSRVFIYPQDDEISFLIRHGEPFKREESQSGTDVISVWYRPIKYDIAVYDCRRGELRINASLVGEKKLYCQKFGDHFFGDEDCFPATRKFTLEPLRTLGADSLACGDIEGIDSITLVEVTNAWGGQYRAIDIRRATDIFADLASQSRSLPEGGELTKAVFKIQFSDAKTPRTVTVKLSNIARYTRDSDAALVERWLELRGFSVLRAQEDEYESALPALANA